MALACLGLVWVGPPAVHADHNSGNDYFQDTTTTDGELWGANNGYHICVSGEFDDNLDPTPLQNAVNSMEAALDEIRLNSAFPNNAWQSNLNENLCGDFDFIQEWNESGATPSNVVPFCNQLPEVGDRGSSIQFEDLNNDNLLSRTVACDRNNNGDIDYFVIVVNTECRIVGCGPLDGNFWYNGFQIPSALDYDFRGVIVHEMGHAIGFDGNFGGGAGHLIGDCSENPIDWSTMCNPAASGYGTFNRDNGNDFGTYNRVLGAHDIGEINDAY